MVSANVDTVTRSSKTSGLRNDISASLYMIEPFLHHTFCGMGITQGKDMPVNPGIRRFYDLKKSQGKPGKVALCEAASKRLCTVRNEEFC